MATICMATTVRLRHITMVTTTRGAGINLTTIQDTITIIEGPMTTTGEDADSNFLIRFD